MSWFCWFIVDVSNRIYLVDVGIRVLRLIGVLFCYRVVW